MQNINLKPLGNGIVVDPIEYKQVGPIVIPESAREKSQEGIVVAVGPGKIDDTGKRIPVEVQVGDRVLTTKYGGTELDCDGRKHRLLSADDILGVVCQ